MSLLDRDIRGHVGSPLGVDITADTIPYSNPRIPANFNGNVSSVLTYLTDSLYPNYKGTVATPASLPGSATNGDFYMVTDDGDGKSAGYVYTVLNGTSQWVKRYDVDWSFEGILSEAVTRTQYMYVQKYGFTDHDATGTPITGLLAGQTVYGGSATNQNLTLIANSLDTTGYVQTSNSVRPTTTSAFDLGTSSLKFRNATLSGQVQVGNLTLTSGSITDSGGLLDFGTNDATTTGKVTANQGAFIASAVVGTIAGDHLTLSPGSILDSAGAITFGSSALTTTGTITAATSSKLADITFTNGTLNTTSSAFSFSSKDVGSIGALSASSLTVTGTSNLASLIALSSTLKTNSNATALTLQGGAGGTGTTVSIASPASTTNDLTVGGKLVVSTTGSTVASDLTVASTFKVSVSATNAILESLTGDVQLKPFSGQVTTVGTIAPSVDATYSLGTGALRFNNLFLAGNIGDGTNTISKSTLLSFRAASTGATTGDSLFWSGSQWLPSAPDSEIIHSTISGLTTGDAGHTQFAVLAGRSGGQTVQGGTGSSENLTLESTSNVTKGNILVKDTVAPNTDASYSSGWSGTDLGAAARNFRHIYSKGEFKGLRFENFTTVTLPTNSGQNVGRAVWDTTVSKLKVDTGTTWKPIASEKFSSDTSWDGSTTSKVVDVSASVSDATTAIWQLCDNANSYERIGCSLKATSTTQVTITVNVALPAGSYRLIGVN